MKNVILLELNEVPFRVLDHFVSKNPGSHIAKLLKSSSQLTTICNDVEDLDPWVSWPTLHRGVIDEIHGVRQLGQQLDRIDHDYPPIWRILSDAGIRTGVFGSVHSSHVPDSLDDYAFYVPDFFAEEIVAKPSYIEDFQKFNLGMTRRSARNVDMSIPLDLVFSLLKSLPNLGVSPGTVQSVAAQLLLEQKDKRMRIRRRSLQPLLMLDVFLKLVEQTKPQFATFYTNHVAAAMHRYWAATFPGDYETMLLTDDWIAAYSGEIEHACLQLDRMVRKLMAHADRTNSKLVVTTSLGQHAIDLTNNVTDGFTTIRDLKKFMQALGFGPETYTIKPAMVPLQGVVVHPDHIEAFTRKLDEVKIDGTPFIRADREVGPLSYTVFELGFINLLCYFKQPPSTDIVTVGNQEMRFAEVGIAKMIHEDGVASTGHHCRNGSLLVYEPGVTPGPDARPEISTTQIAPAILRHFGVPAPRYMDGLALPTKKAFGLMEVAEKTPELVDS